MAFPSGSHVSLRSSVFAATADARFRGDMTLVQIDFPAYGLTAARTVRLATSAYWTGRWYVDPDGNPWQPLLSRQPSIDHGGAWLSVNVPTVDATIEILDDRLAGPGRTTVAGLLASFPPIGAQVTIYQAFDNLTSTSEFRTIFYGEIAEVDSMDLEGVVFHCAERGGWNVMVPPRVVNLDDDPEAPKAVFGTAKPLIYGRWDEDSRYLDGAGGGYDAVYAGIARGACPMLPIEAPTSSVLALPKHLISDSEIDIGLIGGAPYDQWYMYDSTLDTMVGVGIGTLDNPVGGPVTLALNNRIVLGAVVPIEVAAGDTATGSEALLKKDPPRNLEPHSELDYDLGGGLGRICRVNLPDVQPAGKFLSATAYLFYAHPTWTGTAGRFIVSNSATGLSNSVAIPLTTTGMTEDGFEAVLTLPLTVSTLPAGAEWEALKNCYIQADVRATGQVMRVHRMTIVVQYEAAARIERPGTQRTVITGRSPGTYGNIPGRAVHALFRGDVTSPDVLSFDSTLYGYPRGPKDTAAGIYTGTADALIEHPVDVVRHLLRTQCGVAAGEIVENSGDFGAFPDAKTTLLSYRLRAILSSRQPAREHIRQIGEECLTSFVRCPTLPGAPWVAIPWEMGSDVDYRSASDPFVFYRSRNHVVEGSFQVGFGKISDVANTLRVNYDWDPRTNSYGDQLYITPSASRIHVLGTTFAPNPTREALAADSAALYGTKETVVSLKMIRYAGAASRTLTRLFDLRYNPPITVRFRTFVNGYDLNRGHVISFAADWDDRLAYPKAGSDGSWAGKKFRVVRVTRLADSPVQYDVDAVEI